jgi:hypothetical protein
VTEFYLPYQFSHVTLTPPMLHAHVRPLPS